MSEFFSLCSKQHCATFVEVPMKVRDTVFFFRERIERQYMCVPTKNVSFLHSVALYEIDEL